MSFHRLYPAIAAATKTPGFYLVVINALSATIGILYLKDPFDSVFQYLPGIAGLLFLLDRFVFGFSHKFSVSVNELLGYSLILATAVALVGQKALGMDVIDQENVSSWSYTFFMWVFNVFHFFAGASCHRVKQKKSNTVAVVFLLFVAVPLWFALDGKLFLDYYQMRIDLENPSFSHLYISEWCVFLFICAYGFSHGALRPVVIVITFVCLFSLQGRSSTFLAFSSMLMFLFLLDGKRAILTSVGIVLTAALVFWLAPVNEILLDSNTGKLERMILTDNVNDSSAEGRSQIMQMSAKHLPNSILFGDPTFIAEEAHRMGSYMHNGLSMWQFFGLLPFLLMVVILVRANLSMWRRIRAGNLTVMEEIASVLLIYVSVSVLLSKSINFYWLWFAMGYWMLIFTKKPSSGRYRSKRRKLRF